MPYESYMRQKLYRHIQYSHGVSKHIVHVDENPLEASLYIIYKVFILTWLNLIIWDDRWGSLVCFPFAPQSIVDLKSVYFSYMWFHRPFSFTFALLMFVYLLQVNSINAVRLLKTFEPHATNWKVRPSSTEHVANVPYIHSLSTDIGVCFLGIRSQFSAFGSRKVEVKHNTRMHVYILEMLPGNWEITIKDSLEW